MDNITILYQTGFSTREIATKLGCSAATISRRLKQAGLIARSKAQSVALARAKYNWTKYSLSIPSFRRNQDAYWLGFLLGDGCIQKSTRSGDCVRLNLQAQDRKHLDKFRLWLGSNHPITYRKETNSYAVRIVSRKLISILESFGITPNKSKTAVIDVRLANNSHFWRGLVDADGSISTSRNGSIQLVGTREVCLSFVQFVNTITKTVALPVKSTGCWKIGFTCAIARQIVRKLYDGTIELERKGRIADNFFALS